MEMLEIKWQPTGVSVPLDIDLCTKKRGSRNKNEGTKK